MVTEINIGGKLRTVRYNAWFREALGRLYDVDPLQATAKLAEEWKQSYMTAAADVIYCGLVGDARVMRRPVDFTIQDVCQWMEFMTDDEIAPALKVFLDSQQDRSILPVQPEEEGAKKKKPRAGKK